MLCFSAFVSFLPYFYFMLEDYSARPVRITREINEMIGKPFSFKTRILMGGIGSHRMKIERASIHIFEKLSKFEDIKYANVELRPKGIIVHFKNNLQHWIWVIPYYKLMLFQTGYDSIHSEGNFISFAKISLKQTNNQFFRKMSNLKVEFLQANFADGPNSGI